MVKKLVELIGGAVKRKSDDALSNSTKPIFTLPKEVNDNKNNLRIAYHFQGFTAEEDVVVSTRATWFISDEDGDGLIWGARGRRIVQPNGVTLPSSQAIGVLGIVRIFSFARFVMLI